MRSKVVEEMLYEISKKSWLCRFKLRIKVEMMVVYSMGIWNYFKIYALKLIKKS